MFELNNTVSKLNIRISIQREKEEKKALHFSANITTQPCDFQIVWLTAVTKLKQCCKFALCVLCNSKAVKIYMIYLLHLCIMLKIMEMLSFISNYQLCTASTAST